MKNIVRTALGANLQSCLQTNRPVVIKPNTTLNQKFTIFADQIYTDQDRPHTQYVGIGNNGHAMSVGQNNIPKLRSIPHKPRHTGLYNQLPFILRRSDEDLTPVERLKYRLRRAEQHGGENYFAYYLKALDLSAAQSQLELRTVIGETVTTTPFEHTAEDLNPIKPAVQPGYVLDTTGDYIAAFVPVTFAMTAAEMAEYANVCNIIFGEEGYAIISEIALCSGVDRGVSVDNGGVQLNYTEAVGVQITNFLSASYSAEFHASGFELNMNIGSSEPMLEFQPVNP